MIFSRTFSLGLAISIAVLITGTVVEKSLRHPPAPRAAPLEPVSVVDIAHGVDARALTNLVRLRADERVIAVDDRAVANDLAAGAAIAERTLGSGDYLDLTVGGAHGSRRVLVLMH